MKHKLIILAFFGIFIYSCGIWGTQNLGNRLVLFEGDKKEDRAIVYCTTTKGGCSGGIYVIPTCKRHMDTKGEYAEYVDYAKSNRKWVIVRSVQIEEQKENYWIISKKFNITDLNCEEINCDSILQSHVIGPLDYEAFNEKLKELDINLKF